MLVQATDRKFYKKPIFMTPTGVVVTDDYGARCAVRAARNSSEVSARSRAQRFLRDVGINAKILEGCRCDEPILFGSNLEYGYDFDIVFRAMIPVPEIFEAKVDEPAKDESCAGFKTDFWVADLCDYMLGNLTLPLLNRALLGEWIDGEVKLVRRRLLKQAPFLRGVKDHVETGNAKWGIIWSQAAVKAPFDIPGVDDEEISLAGLGDDRPEREGLSNP